MKLDGDAIIPLKVLEIAFYQFKTFFCEFFISDVFAISHHQYMIEF